MKSLLLLTNKGGRFQATVTERLFTIIDKIRPLLFRAYYNEKKDLERKRHQLLLQVTKKFHASMDVGEVLGEIVNVLEGVYPQFSIDLLLSHEWKVQADLPVSQLHYGAVSGGAVEKAYLTGEMQIEDVITSKHSLVYAPLRGKQGIYGVLKITSPHSMVFPRHEIEFIKVLADTGGNALENAELYQQSRELIHDLQLINQTSQKLNSNLCLSDTVGFMVQQISASFHAQEVGFIMFESNGSMTTLEGSTRFFFTDVPTTAIQRLSEKIKIEKDSLFIGDLSLDEPYVLGSYRSVLVVPMIQTGDLKGMVVVMHENPYHFTFDNFKLLQSLIHHSTLAFTNSMLHEELEKLVITDRLTRLYARDYLDQRIQESMEQDAYGCFILFDIDNFKSINDSYGHQVGDDIIIQVANIMKRNSRETDIAARWGGEELALYLPRVEPTIGYQVAERIVRHVGKETSPRVTVSCGVSNWTQQDTQKSVKRLFNIADQCLYEAKETGKNKVIMGESEEQVES
ncbi:diguanylate cyclase [Desertibacillus haloalkaliphilus]|nr:diguanylate cyclase [Desertibacillus haloalkaliphilus]